MSDTIIAIIVGFLAGFVATIAANAWRDRKQSIAWLAQPAMLFSGMGASVFLLGVSPLHAEVTKFDATLNALVLWQEQVDPVMKQVDPVLRRLAMGELADQVRSDPAIETVYIGCQQCTGISPLLTAFDHLEKDFPRDSGPLPDGVPGSGGGSSDLGSEDAFSVTWIIVPGDKFNSQEVLHATRTRPWLRCLVLQSDDPAVREKVRGAAFVYGPPRQHNAKGWISQVTVAPTGVPGKVQEISSPEGSYFAQSVYDEALVAERVREIEALVDEHTAPCGV